MEAWRGFKEGNWQTEIDVASFILNNYTRYTGVESFLEGPTENTIKLWDNLKEKLKVEREKEYMMLKLKFLQKLMLMDGIHG